MARRCGQRYRRPPRLAGLARPALLHRVDSEQCAHHRRLRRAVDGNAGRPVSLPAARAAGSQPSGPARGGHPAASTFRHRAGHRGGGHRDRRARHPRPRLRCQGAQGQPCRRAQPLGHRRAVPRPGAAEPARPVPARRRRDRRAADVHPAGCGSAHRIGQQDAAGHSARSAEQPARRVIRRVLRCRPGDARPARLGARVVQGCQGQPGAHNHAHQGHRTAAELAGGDQRLDPQSGLPT